jgi:hypothetical protein
MAEPCGVKLGEVIGEFTIDGVPVRYVRHDDGSGALCYLDQVDRDGTALKPPPSYAHVEPDGAIWREGRVIGHMRDYRQ